MKNKKSKIGFCKNCSSFVYINLNFSFIDKKDNKKLKNEDIVQFHKRIIELSSVPFMELANYRKEIGFEEMDIKFINKNIPESFLEKHKDIGEKLTVFRLYPNNNPIVARIIGKMINKIFYIFFIDIGGNLYRH